MNTTTHTQHSKTSGTSPEPTARVTGSALRRMIIVVFGVLGLVTFIPDSAVASRAGVAPSYGTGSTFCTNSGGYNLGASFHNVYACGPTGSFTVNPFEVSQLGFQCVEFAERFMWTQYSIAPVYGKDLVGGNFVRAVNSAHPSIKTAASGGSELPVAGDIISMWGGASGQPQSGGSSHVAVVTGRTGSSADGWTISLIEENGSSNGTNTISVSGDLSRWSYGGGLFGSFQWLKLGDHQAPTAPTKVQISTASSSPQATLSWQASADKGGSGLAGYTLYLNGAPVGTVGPSTTTYMYTSVNCQIEDTFSVVALDNAQNMSAPISVPNVVMGTCARAQAMNKIVTVAATKTSYFYGSSGLEYIDGPNTYYCLVDRGVPVYTVSSQNVANQLGNGKPWYPECLSLRRAFGHTVREKGSGASYIVTDDGSSYGSWSYIASGAVYQCLIGHFPRLDADWAEINSLRGSNSEHEGPHADCAPTIPTHLSAGNQSLSSLSLSWAAGANNDKFVVWRNGTRIATLGGSTTSYTFGALSCSATYTLGVSALDNVGLASTPATLTAKTATCPPRYMLSVGISGSGSGSVSCSGGCNTQYVQGSVVTLTANTGGASVFWSWSGSCGGSGTTCTLTVNSNLSVTATFYATYTIQSTYTGKFVSAEIGYSGGDYGLLRARAASPSTWERFIIFGDCGSACSLMSIANRKYVSSELGYGGNSYGELRARADSWGGWETFHTVGNCSSVCAIKSNPNNDYVSAEVLDPGGYYGRLRARSSKWGGWESFKVVRG